MTFDEARKLLLDALHEAAGVLHDRKFADQIVGSDKDIPFSEIEMDSLAVMEVCLMIDDRTGIEVDPADLIANPSLNALATLVAARSAERA